MNDVMMGPKATKSFFGVDHVNGFSVSFLSMAGELTRGKKIESLWYSREKRGCSE
jgi:hypothetical protein